MSLSIIKRPDTVRIITDTEDILCTETFAGAGVSVFFDQTGDAAEISLSAEKIGVRHVALHWNGGVKPRSRLLGDTWERSYGDLEFRDVEPERTMPWYFLAVSPDHETAAWGVEVRPAAFCFWKADCQGITLWLDLRNGGQGTLLPAGRLKAAVIRRKVYRDISPFAAACDFCRQLCRDPLLPSAPVYGSNNWYYAYGNSSHEEFLQNANDLAELTCGNVNRPYMVLDDCWQPSRERYDLSNPYIGGPWNRGNSRFPDMAALAGETAARGIIPGIWIRLLSDESPSLPTECRSQRDGISLDPTVPETAEKIAADIRRLVSWGFRLIKHDFSTYDLFGKFGFQADPFIADGDWHFHDRSRTNAQIVTDFYRLIRENAGDALILGCTCIGHLGAGLMHLNRIGDDVSGLEWERTVKMGVNTLAFRMPQHGAFFVVDADCVGITGQILWKRNREWLHLLAHSGTPLFYSMAPGTLGREALEELREALSLASQADGAAEPLDWMETRQPSHWRFLSQDTVYHWKEE